MVEDVYALRRGRSSLLVSMPHSGTRLPAAIEQQFSEQAKRLDDTDWFIPELYGFLKERDVSVIRAHYSRLLIDLNRPPDNSELYPGMTSTGLCPETLFNGNAVYRDGQVLSDAEIQRRRERYWLPYHAALAGEIQRIKADHGFCILYDAHSIRSTVARLFDYRLPDLNLGTHHGLSCAGDLQNRMERHLNGDSGFSSVVNGRFIGGYITRHYGVPEQHCHALQMEIAQCAYMDEDEEPAYESERARPLSQLLEKLLDDVLQWQAPGTSHLC